MQRHPAALARTEFDLVVIGGGMFGAAAALDAARRGLSTALVEREDFAGATSAHSFKMIHGGIRYLQHADIVRVRHSARARAAFLRAAPHLVRPLPIVVPTYGWGMKGKAVLRLGMGAYELLTADRNRGIVDPQRRIPRAEFIGRDEVRRRYPGLAPEGLTGAGIFCDGQMYNPQRLVLAYVQSAAAAGAVCVNYVEAVGLLERGGRVHGILARDTLTGDRFEVRGRMVLNAAGPYAETILRQGLGRALDPPTPFSRDAYFIVRRPLLAGYHALTVPSLSSDGDAMLSRGTRHLFLVPWRDATLIGVWHKVFHGHPDTYEVEEAELATWIDEINRAYGGMGLTLADVSLASAGLVPFGEHDPTATELKFAHRSRLVDHQAERGLEGLVTLIGVRYTTGPVEAVEAVDLVGIKLGRKLPASRIEFEPVHGGQIEDFDALLRELAAEAPRGLDATTIRALAHNHGTEARSILRLALERPALGRRLPESTVLGAEIVQAARFEMAQSLADVVFRRTELGTLGHPGDAALEAAARIMADCMGWDCDQREEQLADVRARLRLATTGRAMLAKPAASAAVVA